jgi:hypothetical protein
MSALSISVPYPVFSGQDGLPLDNGYVWIGTANLYPITNPILVYFDEALTIQATQPLRTINGFISNAGTPAQIYVDAVNYSILVQDSKGTMVYNFPDGTGVDARYTPGPDSLLFPGGPISIDSALDQITDKDSGSSIIGFNQAGAGAVSRTVEAKLREYIVSVKDYGATGDGVTNDRAAINLAFDEVIGRGYGTVFFPFGTYFISDFIGNTDFSGNTQPVSIGVDADLGTVISCNPAVFANIALFLRFINLQYASVQNLIVNCNDKTSTGIFVTGENNTKAVLIDNCQANDCFGIDIAGATTSVFGIVASSALGDFCSITNCRATNIRRAKQTLACQAIVATGWIATNISNNIIFNVRHDGTALQDADGIVVFSFRDPNTLRYYRPSVATITNNRIVDCEGRFIKLQTHGSALVEGNTMTIVNAIELIQNFQFIDSQVAQATIINNKFEAGDTWTGGASATVASLQIPEALNPVLEANEPFVQKFNNNEAYLKKIFPYGITTRPFVANVASKNVMEVCGNQFYADIDLLSTTNFAVSRFIYSNTFTPVVDVTGNTIWTVAGNKIVSDVFISLDASRIDYTDKWWIYVYDNIKYATLNFTIRNSGSSPYDFPYTSNVMIRDNQMGTAPAQTSDLFGAPINSAKLINGSDFSTGDGSAGVISPAPARWNNGHFGRKGGVLFAETVDGAAAYRYISRDNGANWYQV